MNITWKILQIVELKYINLYSISYDRKLDKVYHYILGQENHHAKFDFKWEYPGLLKKFDIPSEEKHLFDFY